MVKWDDNQSLCVGSVSGRVAVIKFLCGESGWLFPVLLELVPRTVGVQDLLWAQAITSKALHLCLLTLGVHAMHDAYAFST